MSHDNECILVGNGTSVLDRQNGGLIDQFGTVVRFNQFHLKPYTAHVGTKTDVWFMVLPPVNATWRAKLPLRQLFTHSWVATEDRDANFRDFTALNLPYPVAKVSHSLIPEMQREAGTDYHPWSTGALAIWLMLKEFERVTLTGFDWWEREFHHYFDKADRGKLHQPQEEKRLIDRLCASDRLRFL
jgi:hypothetical protein